MKLLNYLKLLFSFISLMIILFGWLNGIYILTLYGGIIYLISMGISSLIVIIESKNYMVGMVEFKKDFLVKLIYFIDSAIILSGFISIFTEKVIYKNVGMIIWFGTIVFYALNGILVSMITKLPLKMTYGGWRINSSKKR